MTEAKIGKIKETYHRIKGAIAGRNEIKSEINTFNAYSGTAVTSSVLVASQSFWAASAWLSVGTMAGGIGVIGVAGYKTYKEIKNNGLTKKALVTAGSAIALGFALPYIAFATAVLPFAFATTAIAATYKSYTSGKAVLQSDVATNAFRDAKIALNDKQSQPSFMQRLKAKLSFGSNKQSQKALTSSVNELNPLNGVFTDVTQQEKVAIKTPEQIANDNAQKERQKQMRANRLKKRQNKNG